MLHRFKLWAVLLAVGCTGPRAGHDAERTETRTPPGVPASASAPASAPALAPAPIQPVSVAPGGATEPQCREQPAQDFLLRDGQIAKIGAPADERHAIEAARKRSIDYRTRQYGRVPGVGSSRDNPHPPRFYAKRTKFMGLPIVLNEKVVPALACVEVALKRECAEFKYHPRSVGGLRVENTFKDYEVSNHLFGIALDIDPDLNPCCHCVGFWSRHDACAKKVSSVFERMVMPKCWVDVFERYGFHWLGHDELQDSMHFEFLGDPDQITNGP